MTDYPKVTLSVLRGIGWGVWDPIGLASERRGWPENCADEYDNYLLRAASMFAEGRSRKDVGEYFAQIASDHMGLSEVSAEAATLTANAIADYMQGLPHGPAAIS